MDYGRAAALTDALDSRLTESLGGTVSRRAVLGGIGIAGGAGFVGFGGGRVDAQSAGDEHEDGHTDSTHGNFGAVGEFDDAFDPHDFLTRFNTGDGGSENVPQQVYEENGRTVREFEFTAVDTIIEIAPGVEFSAWAYNGQVPGPTLRAVEGDLIRVRFVNLGRHAHTIHPHLRNLRPEMDGVPQNGPGVLDTGVAIEQGRPVGRPEVRDGSRLHTRGSDGGEKTVSIGRDRTSDFTDGRPPPVRHRRRNRRLLSHWQDSY